MERRVSWATFASQRLTRARPRPPRSRPRPRPRACDRSSRGRRRPAWARAAAAAPPRSRRRRARARRRRGRTRRQGALPRCRAAPRSRRRSGGGVSAASPSCSGSAGVDLHGRAPDLRLERRRRPLGDDPAAVDDPDAVGEDVRLLEVLRGEEDRDALLPREARDLRPEGAAALRVEAGRRLVEEEDRGPVDERERQVEAALHPAGVGADAAVGGEREADALEQLVPAPAPLVRTQAVERGLEAQVVARGEERVERRLLQRGADRAPHLRALARDVEAADRGRARGRRQQRRQHVDGRRLARAVRAEEAVDLAGRHVQVDLVDRLRPLLELLREGLSADRGVHAANATYGRAPADPRLFAVPARGAELLVPPLAVAALELRLDLPDVGGDL